MNTERGVGLKAEERTESQQQKCVSASATIGALLRYICRRDELNAKRNEECGYGQTGPLTKQQQEACVAASATVALLRYICRRDERNATARARYVTVPEMTDEQLEKHVAASTRSLPIAHAQRSRPLPPPAGTAKSTAGAYPLIN